jgi:adenosylmethionine-8-amino-7-oxononanoate aminotransferase
MRPNSLAELDRAHLIHPVNSWERHEARGPTVLRSARGVIGLAPPLCITEAEIDLLLDRLRATLDEAANIPEIRHALD